MGLSLPDAGGAGLSSFGLGAMFSGGLVAFIEGGSGGGGAGLDSDGCG